MSTVALPPSTPRRWPHHVESVAMVLLFWIVGAGLFFFTVNDLYPDMENIPPRESALLSIDTLLGQLTCLLVPLVRSRRRRVAGGAGLVVVACSALSAWSFASVVHALVTISSWRDRRWLVGVDALAIAAGLVSMLVMPGSRLALPDVAVMLGVVAGLNLWGMYRGQKSVLVDSYRQQAETLRRDQAATVAMASTTGTKTPLTVSARRARGALLPCACCTADRPSALLYAPPLPGRCTTPSAIGWP